MRVLTTAINKGDHKLPDTEHKVTIYALAPGDAMRLKPEPREVVQIGPQTAKEAEYLFLLSWIEGRTVAEFKVKGVIVAQPVVPDPLPRRKRDDKADPEEVRQGSGAAADGTDRDGQDVSVRQASRRRGALPERAPPAEAPPEPRPARPADGRRRLPKRRKPPALEPK